MRAQSFIIDILADELNDLLSVDSNHAEIIQRIKTDIPSLTDDDAKKVVQLASALTEKNKTDKIEVVATMPLSFKTKVRKTKPVLEELVSTAEQTILITGYSISNYFQSVLEIINLKSKQGVVIEFFVDDYKIFQPVLSCIEHQNKHFFKVYEYAGKDDDRMSALHAKTIIIDRKKMFISSANLTYHGLNGNIEIGVLVTSLAKVAQLCNIFSDLKRQKIFTLIE